MVTRLQGRLERGLERSLETRLEIREQIDLETGRLYKGIGKAGSHTAHSYFTVMSWRADSRHMIVAVNVDPNTMIGTFVEVDTLEGGFRVLQEQVPCFNGLVSANDILFYSVGAELFSLDLYTNEHKLIAAHPEGSTFLEPLSITNDETYLGVYWETAGEYWIGTVDSASGEVRQVIKPGFEEPHKIANHAMINPVYRDQIFFAHEGSTEQIMDRIWFVNAASGEAVNFYKQRKLLNGKNGEFVGHEMWSYDGEWLYFVKYAHSPLSPTGVCRVSRDGQLMEHINGDYRYWHACPSPDGQYVVADTLLDEGHGSEIVLIHLLTGKSQLLCRVNRWNHHPGHPHPSFSPDSRKIIFTYADEQRDLHVGIIELPQM